MSLKLKDFHAKHKPLVHVHLSSGEVSSGLGLQSQFYLIADFILPCGWFCMTATNSLDESGIVLIFCINFIERL